jgi:hypothetical protein
LAVADGVPLAKGSLAVFRDVPTSCWQDGPHALGDRRRIALVDEPRLWVPYYHVCALLSRAFLVAMGLRYPPLRLGEDPVFLAACQAHASALSTTSEVTYLYRLRPRAFPEPAARVLEFVEHVRRVRDVYMGSGLGQCWLDACDAFYLTDVRLLLGQVTLGDDERARVTGTLATLWPGESF